MGMLHQFRVRIGAGVGVGIGIGFFDPDSDTDPDPDGFGIRADLANKPSSLEYWHIGRMFILHFDEDS
jgi:hypothetical protein